MLPAIDHLTFGKCECGKSLKPNTVKCANCEKGICVDCEDDAVICAAGSHTICADCLETARKRIADQDLNDTGHVVTKYDYLCDPCCVRQDKAKLLLRAHIGRMFPFVLPGGWLPDIIDQLEAAIEKAKEAL
jgi:hypothetical protein